MSDGSLLEFLRLELESTDVVIRTEAMRRVGLIAALLGPEKTRSELIPLISTHLDDLDQVLLVLAQRLEKFLPLVGGPEHAAVLVPILEPLCDVEEVTVRDCAAATLNKLLRQLNGNGSTTPNKAAVAAFFEMFRRMSNEESGEVFYSRVSSCRLVIDLCALLSEADREILGEIYARLLLDELPIVKRAAAAQFPAYAAMLCESNGGSTSSGHVLSTTGLKLLKTLLADDNQTVTVFGYESLGQFAVLLKKHGAMETLTNEVLPSLKRGAEDASWRIRVVTAMTYQYLDQVFSADVLDAEVFPMLLNLATDREFEVRIVAVPLILRYYEVLGGARFCRSFFPVSPTLRCDDTPQVRKATAELCVNLATRLAAGGANTNAAEANQAANLVMEIMEDTDPLVRLRVVQHWPTIVQEAPALATRLTAPLRDLFASSNWRVRKALMEALPAVASHMGVEYIAENFLASALTLMKDSVEEVRTAACRALASIAAVDAEWTFEKIFPSFRSLTSEPHSVRLSMATALSALLSCDTVSGRFQDEAVSVLLSAAKDPVANVRLAVCQALSKQVMEGHLVNVRDRLLETLQTLSADKDKDVSFFASNTPHQ